jgi:very-short-patch-repair endonuclease
MQGKKLNYLTENNIIFLHNHSIKKIDKLQQKRCTVDFYFENVNLIIEYNGKQHYQISTFGGIEVERAEENLKNQILRDEFIDDFCKKSN